ncbi:MAG: SdiA-regulated domain-containing protein [Cryomorphaceae bacterium]
MSKNLSTLALLLAHFMTQCQSSIKEVTHQVPYDFDKPNEIFELDNDLREISGLAWWNEDSLISIEDENGILYFLSAKDGSILHKSTFGDDGDYEGVAVKDRKVHVLKSNGDIFQIEKPLKKNTKAEKHKTRLSGEDDAEGFCYFNSRKVFLIGVKEYAKHKGKRLIYELKEEDDDIEKDAYLKIDEDELIEEVHKKYGDKWGDNFKPSGLAVNPISDHIYVLSGVNSLLAVFNSERELVDAVRLPKHYAEQPEGICFAPDGTLFISTEGGGGKGKLAVMKMKKR